MQVIFVAIVFFCRCRQQVPASNFMNLGDNLSDLKDIDLYSMHSQNLLDCSGLLKQTIQIGSFVHFLSSKKVFFTIKNGRTCRAQNRSSLQVRPSFGHATVSYSNLYHCCRGGAARGTHSINIPRARRSRLRNPSRMFQLNHIRKRKSNNSIILQLP